MSAPSAIVTLRDVPAIEQAEAPKLSLRLKAILWLLVALGAATAAVGISSSDPRPTWLSLQTNFVYWLMLSAASSCFAAMFHASAADWSRPVARLFQASFPFFIVSIASLAVMYFGRQYLFVWSVEDIQGKELWLNSVFLYSRDMILLSMLAYLAWQVISATLRVDLKAALSELSSPALSPDHPWCKLAESANVDRNQPVSYIRGLFDRRTRHSPLVIIVYAAVMTVVSVDQIMSIDPHWYSTLFGSFIFMSAVYLAFAW